MELGTKKKAVQRDENKTSSIVNTLTGINKALDQATKSKFASSGS